MWSLGAPWFLVAAGVAAVGVVALHLLAWRRPTPAPLPTARFVPAAASRALSPERRLNDLLLLALRVLAVLLAGAALARPRMVPAPDGVARVILADASRAVARAEEVRDSAMRHATGGGAATVVFIQFDSTARVVRDSVPAERREVRGNLSVGLVAAVRERARLARTHREVQLVIVSPFARESWDAATMHVRGEWLGDVTLVPVAMREGGEHDRRPPPDALRLPPAEDAVGAAVALVQGAAGGRGLRVLRDTPSAADSAWARDGGVLVVWPARATGASDNAQAPAPRILVAGDRTAAALLVPLSDVGDGRALVRWDDGTPAATERTEGSGCIRTVGFAPAEAGDALLRSSFLAIVRRLVAPCGDADWTPVDAAAREAFVRGVGAGGAAAAAGGAGAVERRSVAPATTVDGHAPESSRLSFWLLVACLAVLGAEWWARRAQAPQTAAVERDLAALEDAA